MKLGNRFKVNNKKTRIRDALLLTLTYFKPMLYFYTTLKISEQPRYVFRGYKIWNKFSTILN